VSRRNLTAPWRLMKGKAGAGTGDSVGYWTNRAVPI